MHAHFIANPFFLVFFERIAKHEHIEVSVHLLSRTLLYHAITRICIVLKSLFAKFATRAVQLMS